MSLSVMKQLPVGILGIVCSFMSDSPRDVINLQCSNREWYMEIYMNEESEVWSEILSIKSINYFTVDDCEGQGSCKEIVLNLWKEMMNLREGPPKDSLVFENDDNNVFCQGMHVILDTEIASLLSNSDGITFEIWIKYSEGFPFNFPAFLCLVDEMWDNAFGIIVNSPFHSKEGSKIFLFVDKWYAGIESEVPKENKWTHFAGVLDRKHSTLSMFRNGVLYESRELKSYEFCIVERMKLQIGHASLFGSTHFMGQFSDIRVWNQVRSANQIQKFYNKRISKRNLLNTEDYHGLVFNFYPDKDALSLQDTSGILITIPNQNPNSKFNSENYKAHNENSIISQVTDSLLSP